MIMCSDGHTISTDVVRVDRGAGLELCGSVSRAAEMKPVNAS